MIDDSQLASTLLKEGVIDEATVEECRNAPQSAGASLYEALIRGQFVAERDLVGVVSRLLDVPSRDVMARAIPKDVAAMVPASMARRNRVLPLELGRRGELVLGMADPHDTLAVDEIATHTGVEIKPVLVGPNALATALRALYPSSDTASDVADAVLDAFNDFEVGDYLDDAMPGNEWSDYFADGPSEVEDSSVLSREMQDRPSTDVLRDEDVDAATADAAEDELPEIEIIEDLGQPIRPRAPSPYASLDTWEVDGAIDGSSEIVSALSAQDLFGAPSEASAKVGADEEEVDETSNLSMEVEEPDAHTDALETQSSKTSVGVGVKELSEDAAGHARPKKKARLTVENTGMTAIGMGPKAAPPAQDDDTGNAVAPKAGAPARRLSDEGTDYGALGRLILKSGPEAPPTRSPTPAPTADASKVTPDDTNVTPATDEDSRKTNPKEAPEPPPEENVSDDDADDEAAEPKSHTSVVVALFEDDDEPAPPPAARPGKIIPPPIEEAPAAPEALAFALPEDIDARSLAHALANLLVEKGLLTADEITALALRLSEGDEP